MTPERESKFRRAADDETTHSGYARSLLVEALDAVASSRRELDEFRRAIDDELTDLQGQCAHWKGRAELAEAELPGKNVFNYKTRLQILSVLLKEAMETGTPEAKAKFEDQLNLYQELGND